MISNVSCLDLFVLVIDGDHKVLVDYLKIGHFNIHFSIFVARYLQKPSLNEVLGFTAVCNQLPENYQNKSSSETYFVDRQT